MPTRALFQGPPGRAGSLRLQMESADAIEFDAAMPCERETRVGAGAIDPLLDLGGVHCLQRRVMLHDCEREGNRKNHHVY